jgi:hypothetical protein
MTGTTSPVVSSEQGRIPPARPAETDEHKFARQTRTATAWIAWMIGIIFALSIIGGIIAAVQLNKAANDFGSSYNDITNCQSLGGTDTSC